jgi:hypothetical protein
MAKSKASQESRKQTFGKRKSGKATKSPNKHNKNSSYKKRQGSR